MIRECWLWTKRTLAFAFYLSLGSGLYLAAYRIYTEVPGSDRDLALIQMVYLPLNMIVLLPMWISACRRK